MSLRVYGQTLGSEFPRLFLLGTETQGLSETGKIWEGPLIRGSLQLKKQDPEYRGPRQHPGTWRQYPVPPVPRTVLASLGDYQEPTEGAGPGLYGQSLPWFLEPLGLG